MATSPNEHWFQNDPQGSGMDEFRVQQHAAAPATASLSVVIIGPDEQNRQEVTRAISACDVGELIEFSSYPPSLSEVPKMLEVRHDIIVIELDSDPEYALQLVESIDTNGAATTMVYSARSNPELLVRSMRAGAREFLTLPLASNTIHEALERAALRRPAPRVARKPPGRLLVFMNSKGGAGATILATNFAVALAEEPQQSTLLIDLDLPLGDAALSLGIVSEFSTLSALQAGSRLDADYLKRLLVRHSTGVHVLAAPGRFVQYQSSSDGIDRLMTVARQEFDNVVVDVGSRLDLAATTLFRDSNAIYLVTQAGIPELRNANRMIQEYFNGSGPKLEIVLNRYEPRSSDVTEEQITRALTRPAQWKIPNDYAAVRDMQINATPLALADSGIAQLIRRMAHAATGVVKPEQRKRLLGIF